MAGEVFDMLSYGLIAYLGTFSPVHIPKGTTDRQTNALGKLRADFSRFLMPDMGLRAHQWFRVDQREWSVYPIYMTFPESRLATYSSSLVLLSGLRLKLLIYYKTKTARNKN
jgi:hypothetical protein